MRRGGVPPRPRGPRIGLIDRLRAYELQEQGLDTVDSNVALGIPPTVATTGAACRSSSTPVRERAPIVTAATNDNVRYLEAKRTRMGHLMSAEA